MNMIGKRELVFVALLLALPLCSWLFIFDARKKEIPELQQQQSENVDQAMLASAAYKKYRPQLKEKIKLLVEAEKKLQQRQPVGHLNTGKVKQQINVLAKKINPKIKINFIDGTMRKPGFAQYFGTQNINCEVHSSLTDFYKVMQQIESDVVMVEIEKVSIVADRFRRSKIPGDGLKSRIKGNLVLRLTYRIPKSEIRRKPKKK